MPKVETCTKLGRTIVGSEKSACRLKIKKMKPKK
jgi:hypothetical protein